MLFFSCLVPHELCLFLLRLQFITKLYAFVLQVALLNDRARWCLFRSIESFYEIAWRLSQNPDNDLYIVLRHFSILLLLSILYRLLTCNFLFLFWDILLADSKSLSFGFINFLFHYLYLLWIFPLSLFFLKFLQLILNNFVQDELSLCRLKIHQYLYQYTEHSLHSFAAK